MELFNKLRKNGSIKRITTWTFIYLLFFEFPCVISEDTESMTYSSGMDETTTFKEPSTFISLTPFLSTRPTTSSPITQAISTTFEPSTVFLSSTTVTNVPTTVTLAPPNCEKQLEFIASGPASGDLLFFDGDDNFLMLCPSVEVPINSQNMGCFFISANGYITNGDLLSYTPNKNEIDPTKITLMPLWTDIDTQFNGKIYYQMLDVYNSKNKALTEANRNAIKNLFVRYGQTNFNPIWALKITWSNVVPFEAFNKTEAMTFQFILATDGAVTNMAYIYDDCDTSWMPTRMALMGYSYPGFSYYHRDSMTGDIFELGTKGNTQKKTKGVWIFELSKQYATNNAQKCLEWSQKTAKPIPILAFLTVSCPCTFWQATRDRRFSIGPNGCFYLTFPSFGYSKVCCYTSQSPTQQIRSLSRGNLQFNSAILFPNQWRLFDSLPYTYCCEKSDYCSLYNEYRTPDFCENYRPPIRRFTFGDPHIQTLDGYAYTFNGLGEFELLNIYNGTDSSDVLIKIQCRTKEVGNNGRRATVFSSFAIQSEGVKVQINSRKNIAAVEIYGNDIELTSFYKSKDYTWNKGPFLLATNPTENDSYIIRHTSQTIMEISLKDTTLQFSINVGYNIDNITTNGLLGTYNKKIDDDLTTPKGNIIPSNSTEEEIYYKFGLLWKVKNSIFHYENGESKASYDFPNFTPTFLKIDKTSAEYKEALQICTETELDCIYDYLITNNKNLAEATKEVENKIVFNKLLSETTSPKLNGTKDVTVTVNEKLVHKIEVISDNDTLQLEIIEQENCNISFANKEVQISIELHKVIPVKASFQVKNSYNMSTPLFNLPVMICPSCNGQGKCIKNAVNPSRRYEYICNCDKGWRGPYCDIDARCDPLGCTCTGPSDNYTCECPKGYTFLKKCVDIDECTVNKTSPCSQICTNTVGSYKCSCNDGFMLVNGTECVNIDECALRLDKCENLCTDTPGSYKCSCYPGYNLIGKTSCVKGKDVCTSSINCSLAEGCTIIGGKEACFCKSGYTFNDTTKMCVDENECDTITCINGKCENTEGSYVCRCPVGRKLGVDGRICEECGRNKWGENCANTCSGANCIQCNKTSGCVCTSGYQGANCDIDINECNITDYCNTTISTCQNTEGSATCLCNAGLILDTSIGECSDINECLGSNECSTTATCINTFASYTCSCNVGYKGDGKNCTDIDECASENNCDQNCINQPGSYSCTCRSDYKLQDDRVSCKKDSTWYDKDRLYIIIIGSLSGAIIAGILITLWCYYFGFGCSRRKETYFSTLDPDRYYLREAFGSLSSTLTGKFAQDPVSTDSGRATKYLEDWSHFSPYSGNNRQEAGIENLGWEDFGESSSSWGNVFSNLDNSTEFRIERPKFRP